MTNQLLAVIAAAALAWLQILVAATATAVQMGAPWATGNREVPASVGGWAGRANRAARNMLDALPIFAAVALT